MPVTTTKTNGYTNRTPGGIKGRNMTYQNAMAQASLLRATEHGWSPSGHKKARRYKNEDARNALKGPKKG